MSNGTRYDADYFLRGQELGISGYTDYRWIPELTIPMVTAMVSHLGIQPADSILDFGCARGYTVRAFRELGYDAYGHDISEWALENADETVKRYLSGKQNTKTKARLLGNRCYYDWVIAKDVLEHIPEDIAEDLSHTVDRLKRFARKGIFTVVPLAHYAKYDVPEYEKDITHVHRRPLCWWGRHFIQAGWSVELSYRVRGVKDNYSSYPTGNGFITARRLSE